MMEKYILSRLEPQGLGFKVLIQANWHPGMLKIAHWNAGASLDLFVQLLGLHCVTGTMIDF
jgi:hypothetical protein